MDESHNESTGSNAHEPAKNPTTSGSAADETFGWTASDDETTTSGDARATAERMLSQLQSTHGSLASRNRPAVIRIR